MKIRGFEKISTYKDIEFSLPTRKTTKSAGYDFYLPEDVELIAGKITLVPTGVKVYMQSNEYLGMHVRSSIALKKCVTMINNQGIIDADYYDNEDNEGHIMLPLFNLGNKLFSIYRCRQRGRFRWQITPHCQNIFHASTLQII